MRGVQEDKKVDREVDLHPCTSGAPGQGCLGPVFRSRLEDNLSISLCIVLRIRTKNGHFQSMPGATEPSCLYPFLLGFSLVGGGGAAPPFSTALKPEMYSISRRPRKLGPLSQRIGLKRMKRNKKMKRNSPNINGHVR